MDHSNGEYLEAFVEQMEGWQDSRFVSSEEMLALATFSVYLVNLADSDGWEYVGHTFRVSSPMSLLVVKSSIAGVRHIVFTSGRTHTACVKAFLRKMEGGFLDWVPDRFA